MSEDAICYLVVLRVTKSSSGFDDFLETRSDPGTRRIFSDVGIRRALLR